jgi:hypothetical protein
MFKEFTGLQDQISPMMEYLNKCDSPMTASQLYQTATKTKVIDEDKRKSAFRAIEDDELFNLAEDMVAHLNKLDQERDYQLVRNDITQIIYKQSGFFSVHEDYLSLTSNIIQEWTLICNAQTEGNIAAGGETVLHLDCDKKVELKFNSFLCTATLVLCNVHKKKT